MWKNRKRKDADDIIDDGDVPAQKNPKKASTTEDSDSIVVCELSKNRKVSVSKYQGKVLINIREYYTKDGKELPGKKGITLTMDQWKILRDHVEEIDKAVAKSS